MKKLKFNGHYLEMYDGIDELPITRFQEYNRYVMIDSGIGSDLASFDGHISTLRRYIAKGDKNNANQELNNLRQNMAFVVGNTSPRMNAFVSLIKTMNGKRLDDVSDPEAIIKELSKKGLTIGKVNGFMDSLKKKLMAKLKSSFQSWPMMRRQRIVSPN